MVCDFIDTFGRITKDSLGGPSGSPLELRDWQRKLIGGLLARRMDGRLRHRQALIGMARKNGKSDLAKEIGKALLFLGPDGGEVYSVAAEKEQARIVFGTAKRSIEMEPELAENVRLYKDVIEVPSTGSIWRVLSAEAYSKEGLNPTAVIFDEVHAQPNDDLWNVMALAMGSRVDPLMIGITTAGSRTDNLGRDSLGYRLYQYGCKVASGETPDPSFYFAWWEPKAGADADHRDPRVWCEGNPAYGDLIDPEDFASVLPRTPEAEFRTKRTNVWVVGNHSAFPHGSWDACADPLPDLAPPDGTPCVLMVDGSWKGDCTGIVGATIEENPYLWKVDVWERPDDGEHWRVPISDVMDATRVACRRWGVAEVNFDPFRWQHTMDVLLGEGIPVVEFNTASIPRIAPAWRDFYDAVVDKRLRHDGDLTLARHIENMVLKIDAKGARPVKEQRESRRHIDLGICAIGAYTRAISNQLIPVVDHTPVVIRI